MKGYDTPFRGVDSYRPEDEHLFVRDTSIRQSVLSMVLGSPVGVFFGPSGAGKTSFLQASLFPALERRGWMPVRARPGMNPLGELHRAIRLACVPGPDHEALFLELLSERVGGHLPLSHAAAALALLIEAGHPSLRGTLAATDPAGAVTPFSLRWVRRAVGSYLGAQRADGERGARPGVPASVEEVLRLIPQDPTWDEMFAKAYGLPAEVGPFHQQPIDRLLDLVHTPPAREAAEVLARKIRGLLPEEGLTPESLAVGLSRLTLLYASPEAPRFRVVLVLDQFEEIFTRVATARSKDADDKLQPHDVKLYLDALDSLASLMATGVLELHLLVTLREEYVGRLHASLAFLPGGATRLWRLGLLTAEEAVEAVARPAAVFGEARPRALGRRLVEQIADLEDRVQPAHLQILFGEVWRRRQPGASEPGPMPEARELMRGYIDRVLADFTEDERFDVLDMLGMLITPDHMRNIVRVDRLVCVPLRFGAVRKRLLSRLEEAAIVRTEERSGARYAEITHEFLIESILHAVEDQDPAVGRCLRLLAASDPSKVDWPSALVEYRALRDGHVAVNWNEEALEAMLRGALALCFSADVPYWTSKLEPQLRQDSRRRLQARVDCLGRGVTPLELSDLRSLWDLPVTDLTLAETEMLLRFSLRRATGTYRSPFLRWLKEVVDGP